MCPLVRRFDGDGRIPDRSATQGESYRLLALQTREEQVVSIALQPWWAFAASRWAQRGGATDINPGRSLGVAVGAMVCAVLAVLATLADLPVAFPAIAILGASLCTWVGLITVTPIAAWIGRITQVLRLWATGQLIVAIVQMVAVGLDPVGAESSVEQIAFIGVGQSLDAAVSVVMAGVFTLEVEDELRSLWRLPKWSAERRSGRR